MAGVLAGLVLGTRSWVLAVSAIPAWSLLMVIAGLAGTSRARRHRDSESSWTRVFTRTVTVIVCVATFLPGGVLVVQDLVMTDSGSPEFSSAVVRAIAGGCLLIAAAVVVFVLSRVFTRWLLYGPERAELPLDA